ncbi:MAG: phosphoglucosamine mutase [Pirellula sp.]|jgi:phosphomannomutase|nr:phosphoglucosamine mutase [Pirellula sp.]
MAEPIISISGLRGVIGSELTPETAIRYAAAFCSQAPPGPIALSRDGRTTGPMLSDAIAAAILGCGRECLDLGVCATPTVGVAIRHLEAAGGIQVSASHNPPEYNGMKLFGPDGRVIPGDIGKRVLDAYHDRARPWAPTESIRSRTPIADPHAPHLDRILATVDAAAIRKRHFQVLVDSNHGAGAILARRLLEKLGCGITILGEIPDGRFEHPPEPIAENLAHVGSAVTENALDIGFCQDPDADRLAILDENGRYIGEEYTSVLCMMRALMHGRGPLVTNCASSNMTAYLAAKHQVPFYRSKVGEANVVDAMLAHGALYGGEGSGGPIDPRVGLIRDSFVGMAQVLDLMASTGKSVSELVETLPTMAMIKDKMTLSKDQLVASIDALKHQLQADSVSTEDGVRLDWPDAWLLLRGSNTEPIVRLIAEAPTHALAQELIRRAKQAITP